MTRYARCIAQVMTIKVWLVIRTDEVPPHEVMGYGFEPIPDDLSDAQVSDKYGVKTMYEVSDPRMIARVQ